MTRPLKAMGLAGAAALALIGAAAPAHSAAQTPQCFRATDWRGWKATPDARTIFLRVGVSRIYRLDLPRACTALRQGGARLVTKTRSGGMVCTALDLDLKVAVGHGFATPCIGGTLSQLTPDEAAALPKGLRP